MSVWNCKHRTNHWLWLVFALATFVIAGAFFRIPIGKDSVGFWAVAWAALRTADDARTWQWAAPILAFWGLVLAIPAAGLGWVAQAVVGVIWPGTNPTPDPGPVADYADGPDSMDRPRHQRIEPGR